MMREDRPGVLNRSDTRPHVTANDARSQSSSGDRDAGQAAGVPSHVGLVGVTDDRGHVGQAPAGARQAQRALEAEDLVEGLRAVAEGGSAAALEMPLRHTDVGGHCGDDAPPGGELEPADDG